MLDILGQCIHPNIGGDATEDRCAACTEFVGPPRGAGDIVLRGLKAAGVHQAVQRVMPDCGCAKRMQAMNRILPFADRPKQENTDGADL